MRNFFGLVFMAVLLFSFSGCGGGGGGGSVTSKVSSLKYSTDGKSISGFDKVGVEHIVDTSNFTRRIVLNDFYISVPNCDVASYTFSPTELTFDSNAQTIKQVDIDVQFNSPCDQANIEFHRTKTIYDSIAINGQFVNQAPKSTIESESLSIDNVIQMDTSYTLNAILGSSTFNIEDTADINVEIYKKDNNLSFISDDNVLSVTLTSDSPEIAKISVDGSDTSSYNYSHKAQKNIKLQSYSKSGIATIKATALIFDGKKNVTITKDFTFTVASGPISSISLVYSDTVYGSGLFSNNYTVHAVDKYGNPANKGEQIYAGVVNGLRVSSGDGVTPLYGQTGTIHSGTPAKFSVDNSALQFGNVQANRDRVVVLANENNHDAKYLGGWLIQSIDSLINLTLDDPYSDTNTANLTFAIGSEDRVDTCGDSLALADLDSKDGSYTIGDNGTTQLTLKYDPYLTGKDIFMYVNSYTTNGRVGTSLKEKLGGTGTTATDKTCATVGDCSTTLAFTINDTGGEALKNVAVPIKYEGSCQFIPGKTVNVAVLGCAGTIYTEVNSTDAADPCVISWGGTISYDSVAPTSTIYY